MESLSLRLKHMQSAIHDIESSIQGGSIGGGGSSSGSSTFDLGKVSVRPVVYTSGTESDVRVDKEDDILYFQFTLPRPIDDPQKWGILAADSICEHGVKTVALTSYSQTEFSIENQINDEPVILFLNNGKAFIEDRNSTTNRNAPFTVSRTDNKIRWSPANAPFYLTQGEANADYLYIYYGISSNSFLQVREKISVDTISNNTFNLTREPDTHEVEIVINGISYYEYAQTRTIIDGAMTPAFGDPDFTVYRTTKRIVWNPTSAGFNIDNSLSGYITVLYRTRIAR